MGRDWNPNTAAWLVTQRGKRKQDEIVEALAERGQRVSRAWLSRIENGAPFSDELLAAFIDLYGSVPPPYTGGAEEPPSNLSELVTELRQQTAALNRLAEALAANSTSTLLQALIAVQGEQSVHVEANSDRIRALGEVLEALIEQGSAGASSRATPRATGE